MELRVLGYFLAVAREQSIIHAAESLHLSQPTLSTQIRKMEEELVRQLFIRGTKGSRKVTLTEEGIILKKRAEEILNLVEKTEKEINCSDSVIVGDVYIGTGETDAVRLLAKAAKELQDTYPGIHYHISSGNAEFVLDQLDKGLIDFGIVFGDVDPARYHALKMPVKDTWGVLMRRDSILAEEEGLGYAIGLDKIISTGKSSRLCFRPLEPMVEGELNIIWKKYQIFSKAAQQFMKKLKELQ